MNKKVPSVVLCPGSRVQASAFIQLLAWAGKLNKMQNMSYIVLDSLCTKYGARFKYGEYVYPKFICIGDEVPTSHSEDLIAYARKTGMMKMDLLAEDSPIRFADGETSSPNKGIAKFKEPENLAKLRIEYALHLLIMRRSKYYLNSNKHSSGAAIWGNPFAINDLTEPFTTFAGDDTTFDFSPVVSNLSFVLSNTMYTQEKT